MYRVFVTVVISVWAGLGAVAAEETPHEQQRYPFEIGRQPPPAQADIKGLIDEPSSDWPSPPSPDTRLRTKETPRLVRGLLGQPPPASRPVRQPMTQVAVEPVPVVSPRDGPNQRKRLALRLRSTPAKDLAKTLNNLFRAEGQSGPAVAGQRVVVVPEAIGNSLLISGPPDAVDEIRRIVEELKPRPSQAFSCIASATGTRKPSSRSFPG